MHKSRSNRKSNKLHRQNAALKQTPLSQEEIDKRTARNRREKLARYPDAPKYDDITNPRQPDCYLFQSV